MPQQSKEMRRQGAGSSREACQAVGKADEMGIRASRLCWEAATTAKEESGESDV